jgi:hypothetical protein
MTLTSHALTLDYYPTPFDKKCAVLFGTWCGNSRDAAVWISEGMGGIADVFDARETLILRDLITLSEVAPFDRVPYAKSYRTILQGIKEL